MHYPSPLNRMPEITLRNNEVRKNNAFTLYLKHCKHNGYTRATRRLVMNHTWARTHVGRIAPLSADISSSSDTLSTHAGSWTHRPTVLSAPVSVDASPHRTYSPIKIGFTAPSRIRPIGLTAPPRIRHIFAAFFKPA